MESESDLLAAPSADAESPNGGAPPRAIFIHGFATSPCDLEPLAGAFRASGIHCEVLTLAGHNGEQRMSASVTVSDWVKQVEAAVRGARADGVTQIYLIGFSFGAALALKVAAADEVEGVFCISTFVRPARRRRAQLALRLRWFPPLVRRRARVTKRRTRKELKVAPKIRTTLIKQVFESAPTFCEIPPGCKTLFIHSTDDTIADYRAVVEKVHCASSEDVRLVSLSALQHFLHFDIPSGALCQLALAYFRHPPGDANAPDPLIVENLGKREDEVRHWTNVLSLLFFGFFTLFSTIVHETVSLVINRDHFAPYVLFGYSALLLAYLHFMLLYIFNMDRNEAYLRLYIDPLLGSPIGWTSYRFNKWAAGRLSRIMFRQILFTLGALVPYLAALAASTYAVVSYHEAFSGDHLVLWVVAAGTTYFILQIALLGWKFHRWTSLHLYQVPPVMPGSVEFIRALRMVLASITPGSVRQPAASVASSVRAG